MAWYNWSKTASSNATADPTIGWAEGQAPSSINDSARAMMARTAEYRDDVAGAITTGGTSTAFTVTSNQVFDTLAHLNGQMIAFVPNATSTNAVGADVTLNVDGLGAKPIRMQPSVALPNGTLVSGTPYIVVYNNSDGAFYLHNTINPYVIPLGASFEFWGNTVPNSSFALMYGQAISRTTYATLFSLIGTAYGTGDGSTTFNLPDVRGRAVFGKDDMGGSAASRLTSTYFGGNDPKSLGAATIAQSATLFTTNLPAYTPSGSVSGGAITAPTTSYASTAGGSLAAIALGTISSQANFTSIFNLVQGAYTFTGTAQGGASTPFSIIPPAIIANKLMRII